jgi:hypothetical protein
MNCSHCGSIGDEKTITHEFDAGRKLVVPSDGQPPEAFPALEHTSTRVCRCAHCGAYYRWSVDVDSIQGGPECFTHTTLQRMAHDAALDLIEADQRLAAENARVMSRLRLSKQSGSNAG